MKNKFSSFIYKFILLIVLVTFLSAGTALASSNQDFKKYMDTWNKKIKLASEYLDEAESELKNGDAIQGCIKQKKAAGFGIEATESLIKAFQVSGSQNDIENINTGLKKWKELRDFC